MRGRPQAAQARPLGQSAFGESMFDSLQDRLNNVFDSLRGRGALGEGDVDTALSEIRSDLVDADVALPVVTTFVGKVRERALGEAVIRSVTPGQQVVKIVSDTLVEMLGP